MEREGERERGEEGTKREGENRIEKGEGFSESLEVKFNLWEEINKLIILYVTHLLPKGGYYVVKLR